MPKIVELPRFTGVLPTTGLYPVTISGVTYGASGYSLAQLDEAGVVFFNDTNVSGAGWVIDEDNLSSNLRTKVPNQANVKAYVDTSVGGVQSSLATTNTNLSTISGRVDTLSGHVLTVSGVAANAATQSDLDALELEFDAEVARLDIISGKVDTLSGIVITKASQADLIIISGRVDTVSGNVVTNSNKIDILSGDLITVSGLIGEGGSGSSIVPVSLTMTIDNGYETINTGLKGYMPINYDCTLDSWRLVATGSGSIVVDVWYSETFPPASGSGIAGTQKPTLSNQMYNSNFSLTGWSRLNLTSGGFLGFSVDSISGLTWAHLLLGGVSTE